LRKVNVNCQLGLPGIGSASGVKGCFCPSSQTRWKWMLLQR